MISDLTLILLPVFGFLIGLFVAIMGGGGGVFYVPVLTLLFGVPTQLAVATSLAAILPTTIIGAISHSRLGNVNVRIGVIFGVSGIIGALIGVHIANMLPSVLLKKIFGVFLFIMAIPMILNALRRREKSPSGVSVVLTGPKKFVSSLFGLLSGAMAGLFGVSGTPPIIAGLYMLGLPALAVVGTSMFVLIFNAVSGLAGYIMLGQFDLLLIILLGGGGAFGAFIGPKLAKRINENTVEKIYAPLLVGMNIILSLAMILG